MQAKRARLWWPRCSWARKRIAILNPHFGYNAQTSVFEDLRQGRRIDPTKVTRTALQNAASIAGPLAAEALVVQIPEPKAAPAGGQGGGMDGMY